MNIRPLPEQPKSTRKVRLLACRDCRSLEELPDFDGPPEQDVLLEHLLEAHRFPNGEEHRGNLFDIAESDLRDPYRQAKVTEQITARTTGMESEYYAKKNTLQEDALKCYRAHRSPKEEGCNEYRDDKKRIGNPTKIGWKVGPKVYLCDFCVYHSYYVMTAKRWAAGLYK